MIPIFLKSIQTFFWGALSVFEFYNLFFFHLCCGRTFSQIEVIIRKTVLIRIVLELLQRGAHWNYSRNEEEALFPQGKVPTVTSKSLCLEGVSFFPGRKKGLEEIDPECGCGRYRASRVSIEGLSAAKEAQQRQTSSWHPPSPFHSALFTPGPQRREILLLAQVFQHEHLAPRELSSHFLSNLSYFCCSQSSFHSTTK
jgi:hypothetical protein